MTVSKTETFHKICHGHMFSSHYMSCNVFTSHVFNFKFIWINEREIITDKTHSKIPKGHTEIVKTEDKKSMANKMKRKTNIEHTTLH